LGAQHWGGAIEEIRPGNVIWFPLGEKHWHWSNAHDRDDTRRHPGGA
jgi:quercetin dioxygenase-like cupin family protein